ncbi:MAG: hypothetical protein H7039_01030 [Bryobacteraceae bacterium]|nr:hypothetical protein [Bryobacteraceae bacterium]
MSTETLLTLSKAASLLATLNPASTAQAESLIEETLELFPQDLGSLEQKETVLLQLKICSELALHSNRYWERKRAAFTTVAVTFQEQNWVA